MAQNLSRAQGEGAVAGPLSREQRKNEINRTLATSRVSTASLGRFDKVLEGEKKSKGVKRKVRSLLLFVVYVTLRRVRKTDPCL
jgi:regulator of ribosome biosynthesis